ncbi:MAG: GntR family transcriptional regulator [Pseudomonadota bacterium]
METMQPEKKIPAAEQAYRNIRAAIVSGDLEEGDRLIEERLSKELGLSRTPVREAIRRLTLEGFIERNEGYNTRVAPVPADEMEQTFHIRQFLESYAAERAARLATDDDISEIRAICDEISRHTPPKCAEDYQKISVANEAFHRKIVEVSRSPRLTAHMMMAFDIVMVDRTYRRYSEDELIRSAKHHREITDAIAAHAPEWARTAMQTHIRAAEIAASRSQSAAQPPEDPSE